MMRRLTDTWLQLSESCSQKLHEFFHIPQDMSGRHATSRDTLWLMLLNFPNGVQGPERVAKVEVVSSNLISRSAPFYGAPNGDDGSAMRGRFSLRGEASLGGARSSARMVPMGQECSRSPAYSIEKSNVASVTLSSPTNQVPGVKRRV